MSGDGIRTYEFTIKGTADHLRDSLTTVEWAVSLLPERWSHALPDYYEPEAWGAAMNVAHLAVYEDKLAGPVLASLAAGGDGTDASASVDERTAEAFAIADQPLPALLDRLRRARQRQIETVEAFDPERFNVPVTPLWGEGYPRYGSRLHSAAWVATKTFQHTWEHGNAILRLALFSPD